MEQRCVSITHTSTKLNIIMAHINTYKLKVAFRLYGKHYNLLTTEEKTHVNEVVYMYY